MLLKVLARNNDRNATRKLLKYFIVISQQSDRHVAFLPWYSSNNNSSAVPIKRTDDVSKYFKAFQTYCPRLNPKQHTKKQPVYASIFFRRSDYLAQLQKYMSFWLKNGGHRLYKNPFSVKIQWRWHDYNNLHGKWIKTSLPAKSSVTPS